MKSTAIIEYGKGTFSVYMTESSLGFHVNGQGRTAPDAIADFYVTLEEMRQLYIDEGNEFPDIEFNFHWELPALLAHCKWLNIAQFAKMTGINASLLRQYKLGLAPISEQQKERIFHHLRQAAKELSTCCCI